MGSLRARRGISALLLSWRPVPRTAGHRCPGRVKTISVLVFLELMPLFLLVTYNILGPVGRHVVLTLADLKEQALCDDGVVGRVAGEMPVLNQRHEHGARFPPGSVQCPGNLSAFVSMVV